MITMNNSQLVVLAEIIRELDSFNHPDSTRIGKEIAEFTSYKKSNYQEVISKLKTAEPWEYICGHTEFDGNVLKVNSNVLIPRLETLELLDLADKYATEVKEILDVGTGSGAITISIAKRYPSIKVTGIDISVKAIDLAKHNAVQNQVQAKFIQSDLLSKFSFKQTTLVMANLPYIPTNEYTNLDKSVKDFEPKLALHGGKDGLDIIKRLINQVSKQSKIRAVILEIDPSQRDLLQTYAKEVIPEFKQVFHQDFRGLLRFLELYR